MDDGLLVLALIVGVLWVLPTGLAYGMAKDKGIEPATGFALGFFLGWLGVIIVAVMRSNVQRSDGAMKTCPQCAERIQGAAKVCRYCGADVSELTMPGACEECGAPPAHPPTPRCPNCGRERVSS